eukprot:6365278-Ditylum_brightwellii.AAC.1
MRQLRRSGCGNKPIGENHSLGRCHMHDHGKTAMCPASFWSRSSWQTKDVSLRVDEWAPYFFVYSRKEGDGWMDGESLAGSRVQGGHAAAHKWSKNPKWQQGWQRSLHTYQVHPAMMLLATPGLGVRRWMK